MYYIDTCIQISTYLNSHVYIYICMIIYIYMYINIYIYHLHREWLIVFLGYSHTLNPSSCCLGLWRGNVLHFVWSLSPKADFLLQKWMDQPSVFSSISSFVGRWIIFVDPVLRKECRLQTAEYGSPQWRNANQCHIFVIVIIVVFFPDVRLLLAVLVSHVTCSLDRQDNLHCIDIYI